MEFSIDLLARQVKEFLSQEAQINELTKITYAEYLHTFDGVTGTEYYDPAVEYAELFATGEDEDLEELRTSIDTINGYFTHINTDNHPPEFLQDLALLNILAISEELESEVFVTRFRNFALGNDKLMDLLADPPELTLNEGDFEPDDTEALRTFKARSMTIAKIVTHPFFDNISAEGVLFENLGMQIEIDDEPEDELGDFYTEDNEQFSITGLDEWREDHENVPTDAKAEISYEGDDGHEEAAELAEAANFDYIEAETFIRDWLMDFFEFQPHFEEPTENEHGLQVSKLMREKLNLESGAWVNK